MTERVSLSTLPNLRNDTSNTEAVNENFTKIAECLDTLVSRVGQEPDYLEGDIDANSHRIINLPYPATATEPLRKQDVNVAEINAIYEDIQNINDNVVEYATIAQTAAESAEDSLDQILDAFGEGGIKFQMIASSSVPTPDTGYLRLYAGISGAMYIKDSTGTSTQVTNSFTGGGVDANFLNGEAGSHYADIPARLGYTPVNKAGDTVTGQIKGITPVAAEDLTRKDYVDTQISNVVNGVVAKSNKWSSPITLNFTGGATGTVTFDGSTSPLNVPMTLVFDNTVNTILPNENYHAGVSGGSAEGLKMIVNGKLYHVGTGAKIFTGNEINTDTSVLSLSQQPYNRTFDKVWQGSYGVTFVTDAANGELYTISGCQSDGEAGIGLTAAFNTRDASWNFRAIRFDGTPANPTSLMTTVHYSNRVATIVISAGKAYYAGNNAYGQGGQGTTSAAISTFVEIPQVGAVPWEFGYVDGLGTYLVDTSGNGYACGWSGNGNLGTHSTSTSNSTLSAMLKDSDGLPITGITKIRVTKDADSNPTVYVLAGTTVYGSGYNGQYNLGQGDTTNKARLVSILTDVTDFEVTGNSQASILAIKSDTSLWGWGRNIRGELGNGTTTFVSTPVQIKDNGATGSNITGVTKVWGCTGYSVTGFYIKRNGAIYFSGIDTAGSSGLGIANNALPQAFRLVPTPEEIQRVYFNSMNFSGNLYNSVYMRGLSGKVYTLGYNGNGRLGIGTTVASTMPTAMQLP